MRLAKLHKSVVWLIVASFFAQVAWAEVPAGPESAKANEPAKPNSETAVSAPKTTKGVEAPPVAINPFVGEIAVGASLLITYGPQIIALAVAVATLAAGVSTLVRTGKQQASLMKTVGDKLKAMLQLIIGPLSTSNGVAKNSVEGVSDQLLKVAKYVTNSISAPVGQVQGNIKTSLEMSRDIEALAEQGKALAGNMAKQSLETGKDLKSTVVEGGEVQLFRDGVIGISNRLEKHSRVSESAFNQTLLNSKMSTQSLTTLQANIDKALKGSGKSADEVTLSEIGVSGAEVSKQLVEARKYMVMSKNVLADADKSTSGVHLEIMGLLKDIKKDLETFAASNGVDAKALARLTKEQSAPGKSSSGISLSIEKTPAEAPSPRLTEEIKFMVEKLAELNDRSSQQTKELEHKAVSPKTGKTNNPIHALDSLITNQQEALFTKKLEAFKKMVLQMNSDPGNKNGLSETKAAFDLADRAYQESLVK